MSLQRRNPALRKILASCVAIVFLCSDIAWGQTARVRPVDQAIEYSAIDSAIVIPENLGTLQEFYQAPKGEKTVILIQDAFQMDY